MTSDNGSPRQVLFVRGAGAGVHDHCDSLLVDSLARELGDDWTVHYPRMPDEDDPTYARWSAALRHELTALPDGSVAVGHSIGAAILAAVLSESHDLPVLAAMVLLSAPFVGGGGWPGEEFELSAGLGESLPRGMPVHVVHGLEDETAPPAHADLYARAIPDAHVHLVPGGDHQLGNDLRDVAALIRMLGRGPPAFSPAPSRVPGALQSCRSRAPRRAPRPRRPPACTRFRATHIQRWEGLRTRTPWSPGRDRDAALGAPEPSSREVGHGDGTCAGERPASSRAAIQQLVIPSVTSRRRARPATDVRCE